MPRTRLLEYVALPAAPDAPPKSDLAARGLENGKLPAGYGRGASAPGRRLAPPQTAGEETFTSYQCIRSWSSAELLELRRKIRDFHGARSLSVRGGQNTVDHLGD